MTPPTSIFEKIIQPGVGDLSSTHARYVLRLDFSGKQQKRYAKLAEKANRGTLTTNEEAELDEFVTANAILTILQAKAKRSLRRARSAA